MHALSGMSHMIVSIWCANVGREANANLIVDISMKARLCTTIVAGLRLPLPADLSRGLKTCSIRQLMSMLAYRGIVGHLFLCFCSEWWRLGLRAPIIGLACAFTALALPPGR